MQTIKNDVFKFVVLGLPAVAILLTWRSGGVRNRAMYALSWSSPLSYLVWLITLLVFRRVTPQEIGGWLFDSSVGMLIAAPVFGTLFSLILLVCSTFAASSQRWKMAVSNVCMLILWSASVIAPN